MSPGATEAAGQRVYGRLAQATSVIRFVVTFSCLLLVAGCTSQAPATGVNAIKLAVDENGLYRVSAERLRRAGFDLNSAPPDELTLSVGGQPVPFDLTGQGNAQAVQFRGLRLSPDSHTPRNVYWLRRAGPPAQGQAATQAAPRPTATPNNTTGVVTATVHLEQDLQYDPQAVQATDRWYWRVLFAPAKAEIPFEAEGLSGGPGELRVFVLAASSAPVDPDHRLLISINGILVSDAPWDGAVPHLVTAAVPAGVLKANDNQLLIDAPGDTGADADAVHLQWAEIDYPRAQSATGDQPRDVASVTAATASSLPDWPGGADLVIVTVPQFREALKPLVEARQKQGLRVAVLDVEQVYDAFTYGRTEPLAIQALMRHAGSKWQAPSPRYLLLAGDASYDPLGHTKGAESDLVPTHDVYTTFSGWTGSDVWYALADEGETAAPSVAVGRFPAQNEEQLSGMVQKTLEYEAQTGDLGWRSKALLVADNDEPDFAEETAAFAGQLSTYGAQQVTVSGEGTNARDALQRAFANGTGLVGYFGHGSITLWGKEKVFDVAEAGKLENRQKLPIVFTVTCLSGFFEHPSVVSLGEALLRRTNGGAVAALVPSSAAVLSDQRLLAQGLAAALSKPTPRMLGDIVHDAQLALPRQTGGVRDILLTFNLLGDPSMTVRR